MGGGAEEALRVAKEAAQKMDELMRKLGLTFDPADGSGARSGPWHDLALTLFGSLHMVAAYARRALKMRECDDVLRKIVKEAMVEALAEHERIKACGMLHLAGAGGRRLGGRVENEK